MSDQEAKPPLLSLGHLFYRSARAEMTAADSVPSAFFPSYRILRPRAQTVPFVVSSPHSGRVYPPEFLAQTRLDPLTLRRSEDCYVDELFGDVAHLGAPLIQAVFPRAYLDLNREPYELDPELVAEPLPPHANAQSIRVAGGLGTVARIVADGEPIYARPLSLTSVMARIDQLYFPFHRELNSLMTRTEQSYGYAVLLDCHSMPSAAMTPGGLARPDIVLGDRFGTSADPQMTTIVHNAFVDRGFSVQMNRPYAGGYITEHYGRPARGWHALQIEINRGLYMNERKLQPSAGFDSLRRSLTEIAAEVFEGVVEAFSRPAAAE
jgi:N-formylglutamate amidohydrolase